MRLLLAVLVLSSATAGGQSIEAVRLSSSPHLDGKLDEEVWRTAPVMTGFTQREPTEGAPATDQTEVRFAYDDAALWIGARMRSSNPREIRALVTRRDRDSGSEHIMISLDTHRDRRTAYTFGVSAAGVRGDWHHAGDFETNRNPDFNPVWEAGTSIDAEGWTAEIRIPFTQLRFKPGVAQEWGVNVTRFAPARNEQDYWILVKRNETGWSSRMGALTGISGISPSRRIELLPYVATDSRFIHVTDENDPFVKDYSSAYRVGADVKLGVGPNLTLDVTINPDFGQVEADPAQVNLSAYEIFFPERRPFFLEGAQLFGGRGFYYSRRIGAPPPGFANADYTERIENTTILGVAKLTGRLPSGLSIGALAALTDREVARTYDGDSEAFGTAEIAPRTQYAVVSAQQEFGRTRSTFGGMLTAVRRDLESGSLLADLLQRSAYSGILDTRIRWAGGMYDMSTFLGFTHVEGDSLAILRQQRSSRRFWQRPDAGHVDVDPTLRRMSGTNFGINHSKLSGKHWLWDVDYWQEMPGLEPNDMGSFGNVDNKGLVGQIRYRENEPGSWYRNYSIGTGNEAFWNFDGDRTGMVTFLFGNTTFRNFWRFSQDVSYEYPVTSDALTRGGPLMGTERRVGTGLRLQNSASARTGWAVGANGSKRADGGWSRNANVNLTLRPGSRWEIRLDPSYHRSRNARQFVTSVANGRAETFGRRYVFGHVERSEIAASVRVNYTFTPDLTLETYLQPFASSGQYHDFGELAAARERSLLTYGTSGTTIARNADGSHTVMAGAQTFTIGDQDFNVRSLRSNAVLRWEWRRGSTMYLVWQQRRGADRDIELVRPGHLFDAFRTAGDNFIALKVSYWMPVR